MTDKIAVFLLLRPSLLALLENIHYTLLPDASVCEEGTERPVARFTELVREALRYKLHRQNWYLHGREIQATRTENLPCIAQEGHSYRERLRNLEGRASLYSWLLAPWGCGGTGQMLAFISSDAAVFAKTLNYLTAANKDLVVSLYSSDELKEERFRGGIFAGTQGLAPGELLRCGGMSTGSALTLIYYPENNPKQLKGAEIILEAAGYEIGNPVRRRWVRASDESVFRRLLEDRNCVIVTGPDLDPRVMWLAVQDFTRVADYVTQDPLYFGLKALESAAWIYIPANSDDKCEVYLNQDAELTRRFFHSEKFASLPHFVHSYFC